VRLQGTVRFRDLETGVWVLEGDDGKTYLLAGGDRKLKKDGARIEAEGEVDEASATLAMVGPRFVVRQYSFADR
jgi:cob(I)alamin adenosyltransferase